MEATPPPQHPAPHAQPPAQPGYGQSPHPQVPPGGGKLDTADTFDRIFKLYGAQFVVFVTTALVVLLPISLLNAAAVRNTSVGLALVSALLGIVGNALYTGTVVEAVHDLRDGQRDFGVGDLLKRAAP